MVWPVPAITPGAVFVAAVVAELTTTEIPELAANAPLRTASCKVYFPAVENVAVVLSALALAKVTAPGPPIALHVVCRVLPLVLAVPERLAGAGSVTV